MQAVGEGPARLFSWMYSMGWPVAPPPARGGTAPNEGRRARENEHGPLDSGEHHAPPSQSATSESTSMTSTRAMRSCASLRCGTIGGAAAAAAAVKQRLGRAPATARRGVNAVDATRRSIILGCGGGERGGKEGRRVRLGCGSSPLANLAVTLSPAARHAVRVVLESRLLFAFTR